jgi:hypothetical protein
MDLSNLKSGAQYAFRTKPFESPFGDVVPGEVKTRKYIGVHNVGAVGKPSEPFAKVERDDGSRHLIAASSIEAVDLV